MSTKIYNGYYTKNETIETIQNKITSFYQQYQKKIEECFFDKILEIIIENYDSLIDSNFNSFDIFYNEFKDDFVKSQLQNIRCNIDFSTKICFKNYNGKTYWKIFSENGWVISLIEDHFDLIDYHYQNSTDKPFDVSKNDWEERKAVWNNLLNNVSFKDAGFIIIELISFQPIEFFNKFSIKKYLSKNMQRLNKFNRADNWFKNNYFEFIQNLILELKPELVGREKLKIFRKYFFEFNNKFFSFNQNEADDDTKKFFNILKHILRTTFLKYAPDFDINNNIWNKEDCYNEIQNKLKNYRITKEYILNIVNNTK